MTGGRNARRISGTKGERSRLLEQRIMDICNQYSRLTVRQLFYILVSRYGYPLTRRFYKLLVYHLVKLRRVNPKLHAKFVDLTRAYICPPGCYSKLEIWCEKDATRNFIYETAQRYRVPIQVERGFGSLSMFRDALIRARERGVTKILYLGDFDPSGMMIEKVTAEELGIQVERVAITMDQVKKFNPPSRPINPRDSRARWYSSKYGNRCWELESLDPEILLEILESKLKESVPLEFLEEARALEMALEIARKLTQDLIERLTQEAYQMIKQGIPVDEVAKKLVVKYEIARPKRYKILSRS